MQHPAFEEVTEHHHVDDATFKKRVKSTTIILSVVTIVEVLIGLLLYKLHSDNAIGYLPTLLFKGVITILTLAKAYYIVSIFMHLGDEIRNFIMTIVVPLGLFIWFIIAFLIDGNSFKNLKNRYDKAFQERTSPKNVHHEAPVKEITPVQPSTERQ